MTTFTFWVCSRSEYVHVLATFSFWVRSRSEHVPWPPVLHEKWSDPRGWWIQIGGDWREIGCRPALTTAADHWWKDVGWGMWRRREEGKDRRIGEVKERRRRLAADPSWPLLQTIPWLRMWGEGGGKGEHENRKGRGGGMKRWEEWEKKV